MSLLPLKLPTIQNWSCHNCAGCCRQHLIEVTEVERRRILDQGWTAADGLAAGQSPLVWFAGPFWKKRYRLAHQPDGACVFLDERGLCRIHARFGEAAKPLACRVYPYALHPHGKTVTVSLRFSCPSVVANRGRPVAQQQEELRSIEAAVVPPGAERMPPPRLSPQARLDWADFQRCVDRLEHVLIDPRAPFLLRLQRALFWTHLVGQAQFDKLQGARLREFLDLITDAAEGELTALPDAPEPPSALGQMQFRMHVAHYARKDTVADLAAGWRGRWKLLRAIVRFSRGTGDVPPLQEAFRPTPFASLETPFGGLPRAAEELFTRYFRVKIQGLHFCGPAYYGVPFVEGFQSLALMFPVVSWLARWLARSADRDAWQAADIERALAIADHHHGYSDALAQRSVRARVRTLADSGDLARLCLWYAR